MPAAERLPVYRKNVFTNQGLAPSEPPLFGKNILDKNLGDSEGVGISPKQAIGYKQDAPMERRGK
ncbi:hypothetical protein [Dyadobacter frigoris]|uniref:Uncharacterized protein n=1 Tax=Dyadobacter frigoris TaxID=2576211 RepID=A0A4U6DGD1_9BACT|nr:hypothetical protein [Dyadobacter frigoris]TKT93694.1 hypothetical protein FDK13_00330 [Dyadobacter frigoris]